MTARKAACGSNKSSQNQGDHLKDEVYRQMFRLEESRPGAEMGLALALLRAWMAAGSEPASNEEGDWLKKVSPICLEMIETSLEAGGASHSGAQ